MISFIYLQNIMSIFNISFNKKNSKEKKELGTWEEIIAKLRWIKLHLQKLCKQAKCCVYKHLSILFTHKFMRLSSLALVATSSWQDINGKSIILSPPNKTTIHFMFNHLLKLSSF